MTVRDDLIVYLSGMDRDNPVELADRLIALGWTLKDSKDLTVDEERLARAVAKWLWEEDWDKVQDGLEGCREHAAVIAKAYREDTDADPR